jgi:crotonobetaine/carnitine-CoA ligase
MDAGREIKKPLEVLRLYNGHDYTLHNAFLSRLRAGPDRPFILHAGKIWTWRQFAENVDKVARLLVARGIGKGDRVAVMARNSDKHVLLLLAVARVGGIFVPINPEFGAAEAGYVFEHSRPAAVACDSDTLAPAQAACRSRGLKPWYMTFGNSPGDVPSLDLLLEQINDVVLPDNVSPDDTCLIVYTSGTTGFPKGVMHSQRTFLTVGEAFVQRVYLQPDDRVLIVLPMFHMNALFYSVSGTLAAGCAMIIAPRFSASSFWQLAADTGATEVNIIEAIGTILANRPRSEFRPEHKLRKVCGIRQGSAPTFLNEFGIPHLLTGYGMTEIPGILCSPFEGLQKPGSMGVLGRHPDPDRPWAECRVVDDEGHEVGVDVQGELVVKTPTIMQGYYRDPEQTAAAFRDGWFLTGDVVRCDADGYFYFASRKQDIIRRRGENISGAELDRVISEHPQVQEIAAIPVASDLGEDEILVAVVPKAGARLTAEEITRWCGERLAAMKVPRYVLFLEELPHTPTHKVAKNVLRADPTLKARAIDMNAPAKSRQA